MTLPTTAAAIVAGGRARRYGGRDKSRLVIEGRPIIVRQVDVLRRIAAPVFVVGGAPERFADVGLTVHPDLIADVGVIGGIYTALEVAAAERVVVVAGDMPYLDADLLARLIELSAGRDGAWVRSARGPEPLMAVYARAARSAVRAMIDAGRLQAGALSDALAMAEMSTTEVAAFGPPERLLANLNTPEDLHSLRNE